MAERPNVLQRQTKEIYGLKYEDHLFEQYKLYVEMADRISARRMLANSFFVGIQTALVAAFTVLLKEEVLAPTLVGLTPFIAVLLLCYVWWGIIRSYRQLNSGKYKIVHLFEQALPSAPYDAEWIILGKGRDPRIYSSLTHVENAVPICFALLYTLLALSLYFKPSA